mgnify:CR=1 FL=1
MNKKTAKQIVEVLSKRFTDKPALNFTTPYELLVAVILSAQCTDERVNKVTAVLFEKYNNKCCKCGWGEINPYTGNIPLEVEHKDGNYMNNSEDNLELLCPNCHSLTSTYKGANKGKGRISRNKYYTESSKLQ